MGIQLQSSSLPEHIKPLEAIKLFAKWNKTAVDSSVITALGIEELAKTSYCGLSTGQKRRLHLALALITRPDIIFLDEPTAGLDVEGRISLHGQIRNCLLYTSCVCLPHNICCSGTFLQGTADLNCMSPEHIIIVIVGGKTAAGTNGKFRQGYAF